MTRSRSLAAALALAALACTDPQSIPPGARFRQPSAVAAFRGRTIHAPTSVQPYLAVANAFRNDLSILDATNDAPIPAPIQLGTLIVGVYERPSLLAAASLGDGADKADLLVAVGRGDSVLQLVETWDAANLVHSDPALDPLAVDLGDDVLALAPMPSPVGTARIAVALTGQRVAVVEYVRVGGISIAPVSATPLSQDLTFQPEAIAAMPDPDPAQTKLYVATRDEVAPGVFGVAELSADLSTAPRALGARGPTRLVAAARLKERSGPDTADSGEGAFADAILPRVYAVLDEGGCGPGKPIDCGVVVLDADPTIPSGAQAIPEDFPTYVDPPGVPVYRRMPYRIPMRVPGRPLAIAVSPPPAVAPPVGENEPAYPPGFMRFYMGAAWRATTAVAAVASDDGNVYFLDLGRFETITLNPVVVGTKAVVTAADSTGWRNDRRIWFQDEFGQFPPKLTDNPSPFITVTPGFTRNENWTVTYQGVLRDLAVRAGEAGEHAPGQPWLALQTGHASGGGTPILNEVVRLWHPALGVKDGDIVVIKAKDVPDPASGPACVGTFPLGVTNPQEEDREFELQVAELLPPAPDYPGGAVRLAPFLDPPDGPNQPEWNDCWNALLVASSGANVLTGLIVSVRASEYVLGGDSGGYFGRPVVGAPGAGDYRVTLAYPTDPAREDQLAGLCPVAGWSGGLPAPACDAACRDACEELVLARKVRRLHNVSVDCETNSAHTTNCRTLWGEEVADAFPLVEGTAALEFRFGIQTRNEGTAVVERGMALPFRTESGTVVMTSARAEQTSPYGANGVATFDRSGTDAAAGYRFLVSYPAGFVLDASPGLPGPSEILIR